MITSQPKSNRDFGNIQEELERSLKIAQSWGRHEPQHVPLPSPPPPAPSSSPQLISMAAPEGSSAAGGAIQKQSQQNIPHHINTHSRTNSNASRALLSPAYSANASLNSAELSDGNSDDEWEHREPELQGTLSKWTNYIHGWQNRFIALKDGNLVYYKTAHDTDFGCRGSISLQKADVKAHELDELRFDISVNDCVWYLRTNSLEERQKWVEAIEATKQTFTKRTGSAHSLTSGGGSAQHGTGASSSKDGGTKGRGLNEKLAEMETFRDILCRQIDTLQSYFDSCSDASEEISLDPKVERAMHPTLTKDLLKQHGLHAADFKGEAITFKATTAGILATLTHCLDLMGQREETWRRRLEREHTLRKAADERFRHAIDSAEPAIPFTVPYIELAQPVIPLDIPSVTVANQKFAVAGPDFEEGPHSQLGEDEFYDAVESALDKFEEEQQYRDKLLQMGVRRTQGEEKEEEAQKHPLWEQIDKITKQQIYYARLVPGGDGDPDSVWELFAEDGEMKMYKREEVTEDGMVVDPLKALHTVKGVTARELCHYFFSPEVRMEWETTLEHASVLEKVSSDTLIFLQLHKRIWPSAQRDALFWSHMRQVSNNDSDSGIHSTWVVCNKSTEHPDAPKNAKSGVLRVDLVVSFVCDTIIDPAALQKGARITRNDITCKITYCSVINPGGWAPASVLRTVYKREYPRFLKRFTQYVSDKTRDNPILL